ncbi:MAG: pilus assembly protein PilP [Steroidobacteraceae bacterium]
MNTVSQTRSGQPVRNGSGRAVRVALLACALALLAGCGDDLDELQVQVDQIKNSPGIGIEPLPEVKPYETFDYTAYSQRSPFEPGVTINANSPGAIRPDSNRPREFLEQFPLDTLRMVGTVRAQGALFGLVQTKDGLVHRVSPGNHLGQADGRIKTIEEGKISLIEIVPDGMGGFIERPAALALSE